MSRPRELNEHERVSMRLEMHHNEILELLRQEARPDLAGAKMPTKSDVMRRVLDHADPEAIKRAMQKDLEIQQLQRALGKERAKSESMAQEKQRGQKRLHALLRHIPLVEQFVETDRKAASQVHFLNILWHRSGKSWAHVLEVLRDLQGNGPPTGGGVA